MKETILRIIKDLIEKHNGINSDYILECLITLGYTKSLIFISLADLDREYYLENKDAVEIEKEVEEVYTSGTNIVSYDTWFDSYVQRNF